jgi:hypothetical protein
MPTCPCGFDFVKARLKDREFESYAVIHDEDYLEVIQEEVATHREPDETKRLERIAETSTRVGTLMVCPECGALLLSKPLRGEDDDSVIILKEVPSE